MTEISSTVKTAINTQKSVRRSVALESAGFGVAEIASMGVSLGVVAVLDKVIPKSMMDKATDVVSKVCIEPYLDTIEKNLKKCKLKECQVDETKTREERAQRLAKGVVVFGSAYLLSLGAKLYARQKWNKSVLREDPPKLPADTSVFKRISQYVPFVGATRDANMILVADEVAHIGSLIYLNTKASEFTDDHIKKMSGTLEKLGVSPQKAKEVSTMAMVWEVPNVIGMLAGGGAVFAKHAYGWPDKHNYQKLEKILDGTAKSTSIGHSLGA